MTHQEWAEYAEDLYVLIARTRGLVYEHEDKQGAVQLVIQPRRRTDITRIRFPRRASRGLPTVH